jgi:hypothetical protein
MQNTLVHIYPIHKGSQWVILKGTLAYVCEDDESVVYEMKLQKIFSESMQISGSFQNITYRSTEVHLPLDYCSLERFKCVYKILP